MIKFENKSIFEVGILDQPLKILVVDDEPSILESLATLLSYSFNSIVETATSGNAAIALLEKNDDFKVIVCDYQMPNGNGVEVLRFLENKGQATSFIMFTSMTNVEEWGHSQNARFVNKPDIRKLLDTINELRSSSP